MSKPVVHSRLLESTAQCSTLCAKLLPMLAQKNFDVLAHIHLYWQFKLESQAANLMDEVGTRAFYHSSASLTRYLGLSWKILTSGCFPDILIAVSRSLLKACICSVLGGFSVAHTGLTLLCRWAGSIGLALWLPPGHSQETTARGHIPATALTAPAFAHPHEVNRGLGLMCAV